MAVSPQGSTRGIQAYLAETGQLARALSPDSIKKIVDEIMLAYTRGQTIFIFGNGGSAATASHLACDLGKGTVKEGRRRFKVMSLSDNIPMMTAWANDTDYSQIFCQQLKNFVSPKDVVLGISSSGNSANVLEAFKLAREMGAATIGLTGFQGGKMKELCQLCLVVPSDDMQHIEDVQMVVAHLIFREVQARLMEMEEKDKVVFLDRDGVINRVLRNGYVRSWKEFVFLPGSLSAIRELRLSGFQIFIVSNQAGVGKGIVGQQALQDIHARLLKRIEEESGEVKAVYFCQHRPEENCRCRKPEPGLLLAAARDYKINLSRTYLVGDTIKDIQAGQKVGAFTILVKTGKGKAEMARRHHWPVKPDHIATSLATAANFILRHQGEGATR